MILVYTGILTIIIGITMFFVLKYISRTRVVDGPKIIKVSDCKDDTYNPEVYGPRPANYVPQYFCKIYTEVDNDVNSEDFPHTGFPYTDTLKGDPQSYVGKYSKQSSALIISKWYWITSYIIMGLGVLQLAIYLFMYLLSPR